jgi:hypothetical protein
VAQVVTALSDAALRAACRPRPWERHLRLAPIAGVVAGAAVFIVLAVQHQVGTAPALLAAVGAFTVVAAGLFVVGHGAATRRKAPLRAELARRYGVVPVESWRAPIRAELERDGAPDHVIIAEAMALPGGGHRFVRIDVGRTVHVEVRAMRMPRHSTGLIEDAEVTCTAADVEAPELRTLLTRGGPLARVPATVKDGMPCELLVVTRAGATCGACNVADEETAGEPTAVLARAVLALAAQVAGD